MRYLLDTHVILWMIYDSKQLSNMARSIVKTERCYVSEATLWEIAIKVSIGKLKIKQSVQEIAELCVQQQIEIIDIAPAYCDAMIRLPPIHHDPFDRIIIATAQVNGGTIVTKDRIIPQYDVPTIW